MELTSILPAVAVGASNAVADAVRGAGSLFEQILAGAMQATAPPTLPETPPENLQAAADTALANLRKALAARFPALAELRTGRLELARDLFGDIQVEGEPEFAEPLAHAVQSDPVLAERFQQVEAAYLRLRAQQQAAAGDDADLRQESPRLVLENGAWTMEFNDAL